MVFGLGLLLLVLFLWYFATDSERRKRILGLVLTVLLTAVCVQALWPRHTNRSLELIRLERLQAGEVTEVRSKLETWLRDNDFRLDPADERTTFPGKRPENYNTAGKLAYQRVFPDVGAGRIYVIDGDTPGSAGHRFVNIYRFWEGERIRDKRTRKREPPEFAALWKDLGKVCDPFDKVPKEVPIQKGIDLEGGSSFQVEITPREGTEVHPDVRDQAIAIISQRLNALGGKDLLIAPQGENMIMVQMPGISDEDRDWVKEQLEKTAVLEFRLVHQSSRFLAPQVLSGEHVEPGYEALPAADPIEGEPTHVLVKRRPDIQGKLVKRARAQNLPDGWHIFLDFNSEGVEKFGKLTNQLVTEFGKGARQLAIVLDGEVLSAPSINDAIWGTADISGQFDSEEAKSLAASMENPLEEPLLLQSEHSVDPTLGREAVKQGLFAGLAGLSLTFLFLLLYYRLAGWVALVGLTVNMLMLLGAMAMFGFTLTLPGIAGIILTIGMAVDANVLIYERLKEEIAEGKSLTAAIQGGYEKAFSAIFDANTTTLITSAILCYVADGPVRGFAVTLMIGIVGTMFTGLLVTRVMFNWATHLKILKKLSFWNIIPDVRADFLGKRRIAFILSGILAAVCIAGLAWKQDKAVGVDFLGGDLITLKSGRDFSIPEVDSALAGAQLTEKAIIQKQTSLMDGEHIISIRMSNSGSEATFGQMDRATASLKEGLQLQEGEYDLQRTTVGSVVGGQMLKWSTYALLLGVLGIFLYLCFRYEISFALGAIVALVHDVFIALGVVVLMGQEISLVHVGAFLTIAGYSINDTIVVFDRIREGLRTKRGEVKDIMNEAIGITLRRTLLTSATTLIPMATLYLFGGPALRDFSFTIIVGVAAGTYSTIFMAAPVVLWWARKRKKSLRREVLDSDQAMVATTGQAKT